MRARHVECFPCDAPGASCDSAQLWSPAVTEESAPKWPPPRSPCWQAASWTPRETLPAGRPHCPISPRKRGAPKKEGRAGPPACTPFPERIRAVPVVPERRGKTYSTGASSVRSEEHTSELQSRENLVCRLLLEKKKTT